VTTGLLGAAVLACGVLLAKGVHQPAELLYEHKSTWGGFLKGERGAVPSSNDLSINDITLLKTAERDRKKERLADAKTERKDQAAWHREQMKEKLAQLKKQKAKAKEAAEEAALAASAPKSVHKAKTMHAKKGLNLSRRDKQLLDIANTQIKKHHAEELAEERKDQAAEKSLQQAKDKARAAYLAKHPRSTSRAKQAMHPAAAVSKSDSWGGFLPKVTLASSTAQSAKQAKPAATVHVPASSTAAGSKAVATEEALQKVGVNSAALKLLASAEKDQSRDTKRGNAMKARDDRAYYQLAKKKGSIFFDHKAREEAQKEVRHYEKEAQIGLTQATEDDEQDYREAWRK